MDLSLCDGFQDPIGADRLTQEEALGLSWIRRDVTADNYAPYVEEFRAQTIAPIITINGGKMLLGLMDREAILDLAGRVATILKSFGSGRRRAIEFGNEPDYSPTWQGIPGPFGRMVNDVAFAVWAIDPTIEVVIGGVGNLNTANMNYLAAAMPFVPLGVIVGAHLYDTTLPPQNHAAGFTRWRQMAGGRERWITESGRHTAPSNVRYGPFGLFHRTVQFTDQQVADYGKADIQACAADGVTNFVYFQAHDGDPAVYAQNPSGNYELKFGIWTWEWLLKPVGHMLADLAAGI